MGYIEHLLFKDIPFFFRLASNAFPDIGSVGWIEKKNHKKLKRGWPNQYNGPNLNSMAATLTIASALFHPAEKNSVKFLCTTSPPTQHHSFFTNYPLYSLFRIYPSKIALRSRSAVDVIGNLSGLEAVVFLWRFGPLLCNARAICGTRSPRVTTVSSLYDGK